MILEDNKVPLVNINFYECHKYYDMSFSEYHKNFNKYRLSGFCDKKFMLSLISNTFDEFGEKLTVRDYSDEKVSWNIQYGTKPLEELVETYKEKNIIRIGRSIATEVAEKAITKFNFNNEIYTNYLGQTELDYIINRKGWASFQIELRYDYLFASFIIIITIDRGDDNPMKYVINKIYENFNPAYYLWYLRKNYINLLEGLPLQTSRDNILNYLLNPDIGKELCSFMR